MDAPAAVGRGPRTTHQAIVVAILGALAAGPLTLRELHLRTGLPRSTVRTVLESLVARGRVGRAGAGGLQDPYSYHLAGGQ